MTKMEIIICDLEESFAKAVADYIISGYSQQFQVRYFTNIKYLNQYLMYIQKKIDILLLSFEMHQDFKHYECAGTVIFLSTGKCIGEYEHYDVIFKYQTGDRLVSNIMNIYSKRNPDMIYHRYNPKLTRVVAIYSPAGGTGKTCISVAASLLSAQRGGKVFYLNFETIQSTPLFFQCDNSDNFSHLIYYIKEKRKDIQLKIEGIRCSDNAYGNVHYFCPPDTAMEMEDMQSEDIQQLINIFRTMNQYDTVFIDMSNVFDNRALTILQACDKIILVFTPDMLMGYKKNAIEREINMHISQEEKKLTQKVIGVLNRYRQEHQFIDDEFDIFGEKIMLRIPDTPSLIQRQGGRAILNTHGGFGDAIHELVNLVTNE